MVTGNGSGRWLVDVTPAANAVLVTLSAEDAAEVRAQLASLEENPFGGGMAQAVLVDVCPDVYYQMVVARRRVLLHVNQHQHRIAVLGIGTTDFEQSASIEHIVATAGYLSSVTVTNIRSIMELRWVVPATPGWNVILGDNGAGKSSFLRTIGLLLLPHEERVALRLPLRYWLRTGATSGRMALLAKFRLPESIWIEDGAEFNITGTGSESVEWIGLKALFSAGFGPFRRFTGGDPEYERQFDTLPRVARHLSLFDERIAMTESLEWLKQLRFKQLEKSAGGELLDSLKLFINQEGFLPNGVQLSDVTSDAVQFVDGNGSKVATSDLSDGYRSILSLTFELIRQLAAHFGPDHVFDSQAKTVIAPGIVLIDEVDAHLHPRWQRRIGLWLREHFPNIQFIVTTHSPLICQAAEVGSVFRLPRPGTDEQGRMVTGAELDRLLYGDLVDAYGTPAMGGIGRSEKARELLTRLTELNRKEIEEGLTEDERKEQRRLRATFPAAEEGL